MADIHRTAHPPTANGADTATPRHSLHEAAPGRCSSDAHDLAVVLVMFT